MSGFDLTTAVIAGRWSVDNYGNDILVNGVSTGASAGGFSSWYGFSVNNSLLTSGINTIDFVVQDVGGISGFRSEFTVATADELPSTAVPEASSTLILLGLGLLGLTAVSRRR